jgi:putative ABC transport system substrate-binding protein
MVTVDTPPTRAAQEVTNTIPIVVAVSADPIRAGLVKSLAHPDGNTTGLARLAPEPDQKSLEFLKETLPQLNPVAMIFYPNNPGMMLRVEALKIAAPSLGLKLELISALGAKELAGQPTTSAADPPDAMIVLFPIYAAYRNELCGEQQCPAVGRYEVLANRVCCCLLAPIYPTCFVKPPGLLIIKY